MTKGKDKTKRFKSETLAKPHNESKQISLDIPSVKIANGYNILATHRYKIRGKVGRKITLLYSGSLITRLLY